MMPLISVVVPIYNVEEHLFKCLDSLAKQTLKGIQIICVNDGSKDKSQEIIDQFAEVYPNFISVIKPNGGLSDARNYGMQFCEAPYVGFLDGDDFLDDVHFERLYEKAIQENADLVVCDVLYEWSDHINDFRMKGIADYDVPIKRLAFLSPLFAWNKLYKKSLFEDNHLSYPLGLWYEDIPVTLPIFALAKKIAYQPDTAVHYVQRNQSIMGTKSNSKMKDILTVLELSINKFKLIGEFEKYYSELELVCIEQLMLYGSFRAYRSEDSHILMKLSFEFMNKYFPKWKLNTYLVHYPRKYRIYLNLLNPMTQDIFKYLVRMSEKR